MNFEAVIGLEIHVEMSTKTKMFSAAPVTYKAEANAAVTPLDLGHPGTMPVVNSQAIINAIQVCHALQLTIDPQLWFDRKNYFYPDLPKGYQITQNARPMVPLVALTSMLKGRRFQSVLNAFMSKKIPRCNITTKGLR